MADRNGFRVIIALPVLLIGGTEIQTLHLVRALTGCGYSVTVCCYHEYDRFMVEQFESAGASVETMNYPRPDGLWSLAKGLRQYFTAMKPDILHVQYIAPGLVPIIAARLSGIKIIFATVHQPGSAYGIREKILIRSASRLCTALFCASQAVEKSWFGSSRLFDPDKIDISRSHFTIYNCVDSDRIASAVSSADRRSVREKFHLADYKIIGFVGRLRHEKGLDILLDAMPHILDSQPDAVLVVVGDGPDRDRLKKRAEDLSLKNHVRWLGQKSQEEVYQLYSIMDVVAVPSRFEGFGLTAAEAMAAGIPVVGTAVDGLKKVIEEDETGYLVKTDDLRSFSNKIVKLLQSREFRETMGRNGILRIQSSFSLERFYRTVNAAYDQYIKHIRHDSQDRRD